MQTKINTVNISGTVSFEKTHPKMERPPFVSYNLFWIHKGSTAACHRLYSATSFWQRSVGMRLIRLEWANMICEKRGTDTYPSVYAETISVADRRIAYNTISEAKQLIIGSFVTSSHQENKASS